MGIATIPSPFFVWWWEAGFQVVPICPQTCYIAKDDSGFLTVLPALLLGIEAYTTTPDS